MPYNNAPIVPAQEITGAVSLPLARVKKIINTDPDTGNCSNNAAFVITVATEMFLQHLVSQAHLQVRSEHSQKPRRNIQYRDVANAVARVENLEFLSDVVPRTMTYKDLKKKQAQDAAAAPATSNGNGLAKGQGTLDGHLGGKDAQAGNGAVDEEGMDVDGEDEEAEEDDTTLEEKVGGKSEVLGQDTEMED
ncbi:unnamed protein product [Zymoseptoria tritici ST99CH_1A5]|uniref:Transcription factor CBF/NF-Y/archaeal histone domain-containing protein n=3 Tax=Zymoseptoria tritici TaxID=1047171 RepID=A0A2H1GXE3_ZYMTR|nr:unnamed protein product [Zymoseptoria tritici ST99CH_1E4]SMY27400.1 unnamed protein product [Zymoseptoria tritici ST99CH_1A5]